MPSTRVAFPAALNAAALVAPRVEAEIAFRLGRTLTGLEVDVADVLAAVAPASVR